MRTHRFATPQLPAEIVKEAFKIGRSVREVAREQTNLSEEDLDEALDAKKRRVVNRCARTALSYQQRSHGTGLADALSAATTEAGADLVTLIGATFS